MTVPEIWPGQKWLKKKRKKEKKNEHGQNYIASPTGIANNNNNNNETGSRLPCMRPRSDPPNFSPIERGEMQTNNID